MSTGTELKLSPAAEWGWQKSHQLLGHPRMLKLNTGHL